MHTCNNLLMWTASLRKMFMYGTSSPFWVFLNFSCKQIFFFCMEEKLHLTVFGFSFGLKMQFLQGWRHCLYFVLLNGWLFLGSHDFHDNDLSALKWREEGEKITVFRVLFSATSSGVVSTSERFVIFAESIIKTAYR